MNQAAGIQNEDKPVAMNALLAEFNAMRSEIIFRATSQSTLMQINLTAAAAITSFALANQKYIMAMIIIPILSPALGIFWLDHDATIMKLGMFIEEKIKPTYSEIITTPEIPDYQRYTRYVDALLGPRVAILNFNVAVLITFGLLPLSSLVYVAYTVGDFKSFAFLAPAAAALVILLMFFLQFAQKLGLFPKVSVSRTSTTSSLTGGGQ